MSTMRKLVRAQINALGEDEVEVVMSTAALARDGHILLPQGCRLENYRANPIVLWSHDPDKPIGNAENIEVTPDQITARIKFAPLGISAKADEIRGLMKAGVVRAVSVGFDPIDGEPLDPKRPRGGQRFTQWELLELSPVSVPADTGAMVTARSNGEQAMADENGASAPKAKVDGARAHAVRGGKVTFQRGLYQVAELCWLFEQLGWHVDMAKFEAAIEGDASEVPGMLASILHDLGDALLAMAEEEVAEALAGHDVEPQAADDDDDEVLVVEERQHIAAASSPAVRAFRRGVAHAKLRAGKTLSAESVRCLNDAMAAIDEGMDHHRSGMKKGRAAKAAIADLLDRAGSTEQDPAEPESSKQPDEADGAGDRATADFRRRQADILALGATH